MKYFYKMIITLVMLSLLIACGGGENDNSTSSQKEENRNDVNYPISTEIEVNDTKKQANPLVLGKTITGSIKSKDDIDWFGFYSTGGIYSINVSLKGIYRESSGLIWVVTVHDENDNVIYKFNVHEEELNSVKINLATAGNYYVSIDHNIDWAFNNEPYFLTVNQGEQSDTGSSISTEIEVNDTKKQANPLVLGKTITGSIKSKDDIDWFGFYSTGGIYSINVSLKGIYRESSGLIWVVTVHDENDNVIYKFNVHEEELNSVKINLATAGNYYVSIEALLHKSNLS